MRRTFLSARPSRAVFRAFGSPQAQSRRTFATPPIKDDSPPTPIEPSKTQAHPVGPFYEAVLRTPQALPEKKPEEPPVTSQESSAPAPAPEEKPAADDTKSAPKRTRKPRQTSAATGKDKSVPPSSSSSSFSSTSPSSSSSPSVRSTPSTHPPPPPHSEPDLESPPSSNTTSQQQNNRITFAASLAGPTSFTPTSLSSGGGELIAGVLVPPRPEEPDNCCMSGCVNCVWDRYRDEMDLWADRAAEAERRVRAADVGEEVGVTEGVMDECGMGAAGRGRGMELGVHEEVGDRDGDDGVVGMEDDGGRITKDFWDEELYKHVPVGIREFMKQEKRLKEKHRRQGTLGG